VGKEVLEAGRPAGGVRDGLLVPLLKFWTALLDDCFGRLLLVVVVVVIVSVLVLVTFSIFLLFLITTP